ncbi:MAG TPA: ABC transporter ATP-binding protein [Actinomycetota bacterium]|nr:ABC transporter ATP-binding protein [Actinomycetota bacterium]
MTEPVVRTEGLRKVYGSIVALDAVDLRVEAGSIYGLVGPNGAGKSTLIGLLAGLRHPSAGSVHLGVERRRMAVMPDTPRFDPWLTAREVVDLARAMVTPQAPASVVGGSLSRAGLGDVADRRVGGFSRGMLQRLGIAATIVSDPDLLVFDEPASALDPLGRYEVLELIGSLAQRSTILFASHILADVQRVCDTVGVLREGRLLYQGPLASLLSDRVQHAYVVRVREPVGPLREALGRQPWVREATELGHGRVRIEVTSVAEAESNVAAVLTSVGAHLVSFEPEAADLESVFLELTSREGGA